MTKIKLLNRGDIIRTNPSEGYWGIAIVLSETEKTPESHPKCHIAITSLLYTFPITFNELNIDELKPMVFDREYELKEVTPFLRAEICIGVYTRRNKTNLEIIGSVNPALVYDGPLPFIPLYNLKITWPLYGDPDNSLGNEAYIAWKRKAKNSE